MVFMYTYINVIVNLTIWFAIQKMCINSWFASWFKYHECE